MTTVHSLVESLLHRIQVRPLCVISYMHTATSNLDSSKPWFSYMKLKRWTKPPGLTETQFAIQAPVGLPAVLLFSCGFKLSESRYGLVSNGFRLLIVRAPPAGRGGTRGVCGGGDGIRGDAPSHVPSKDHPQAHRKMRGRRGIAAEGVHVICKGRNMILE
jgi:hypothetical protein